jgi:hypothetical protein
MTEPTDKIDEQQLDEYLKGDSSVSRHYRQLPGADVPPSLDRLVLRQAEEAVKRPSRPAWMRWTAPLAVAATAVLVVSIVVETGLKNETLVSAPVMQEKRAAAPEAPIETKMIEESADMPPPPKLEVPPAPPPVAAPAPAAAPPTEQVARARQPVASEAAGAVPPEPAPAPQANSAAFVADAERQKQSLEEAARAQELSASQRAMRGEQDEVAGPRDTVEKPEPKAVLSYSRPISASADSMATLQKTYADPEAWLKDIRQLRKDNKQEEADREWRRFVATFPDYEVAETDAAREVKK